MKTLLNNNNTKAIAWNIFVLLYRTFVCVCSVIGCTLKGVVYGTALGIFVLAKIVAGDVAQYFNIDGFREIALFVLASGIVGGIINLSIAVLQGNMYRAWNAEFLLEYKKLER